MEGSAVGGDLCAMCNCAVECHAPFQPAVLKHPVLSGEMNPLPEPEPLYRGNSGPSPGHFEDRWIAALQADFVSEWILSFCRSCLLFYLLSCCLLLFRTFKLQPKSGKVNRVHPSSLQWVYAFMIPGCVGMQHADPAGGSPTVNPASLQLQPSAASNQGRTDDGLPRGHAVAPEFDDPRCLAEVFQFQHSPCYHAVWIDPVDNIGYVRCTVQDELFCAGEDRLVSVCPQPDRDCAVLLDAPDWILSTLSIPVLVEVRTSAVKRYVDMFTGKVDAEVIRLSLGDAWPAGGRVFIGDSLDPLQHGQIAQLQPGVLIRIIPRGLPVPRCFPLEAKIAVPRRWFSFKDRLEEYSLEHHLRKNVGLVGVMGDWSIILADSVNSISDLKRAIGESCGCDERAFQVNVPSSQPFDLFFRGCKVVSLIAVMPRALASCYTLFLDNRELAIPVTALFLPPLRTSLERVLRLAGAADLSVYLLPLKVFWTLMPRPKLSCLSIRAFARSLLIE